MSMRLDRLNDKELRELFEERKAALIEVRDEIDRRDALRGRPAVDVDFTQYVAD